MYGFSKIISLDYDAAVSKVKDALKEEGFGILSEIDVKDTFKKKLDADFRRYVILGACNPPLAQQAFNSELEIGLLLPCNVVVYENDDGGSTVAAIDAEKMLSIVGKDELKSLAQEVNSKLARVLNSL